MAAQSSSDYNQPDQQWVGLPIVMLRGWGAVHHADHDRAKTAVGINIVTTVARVEGSRLWVTSTGGDDSGWIDSRDVLPLTQAIPYFNSLIAHDPLDWDAYLRRAEAEHALNQRDVATADYTRAIELHPREAFLYLRRGRHYNTLNLVKTNYAILKPRFDSLRTLQGRIIIWWQNFIALSQESMPIVPTWHIVIRDAHSRLPAARSLLTHRVRHC